LLISKVKWAVLKTYFKSCGIFRFSFYIFLFSLSNVLSVVCNYWINLWTNDAGDNQQKSSTDKSFRFLIYLALGLAQCVFTLLADFIYLLMSIRAACILHDSMLYSILRSTMEFFESTPSGRIINRFSKDVDAAERTIPESFKSLGRCVFHVFFTVLVIVYSTPWFAVTLVPMFIVYVFVQRYFVASMRQLKRLESASKSPIFSHFSESLTGVSTIRAFKADKRFVKTMEKQIDENLVFYFPNIVSNRWLALRLEFVSEQK
jgi:ABC-type multidrug transport system fused ATPase/permease subunit